VRKNITRHTHMSSWPPRIIGGETDERDGVVCPWCRTPKASGGSAHRSAESPPAPHACYEGALLTVQRVLP
jgi:hypothetical protein